MSMVDEIGSCASTNEETAEEIIRYRKHQDIQICRFYSVVDVCQ
jgi:hypothetical protein